MKKLFFILILGLAFVACNKDEDDPKDDIIFDESGVYVCNQGNFNGGNATLTYYNPKNDEVQNDVFYDINNFPIGDILNSITVQDDNLYLVVNNSNKIHVVKKNTLEHVTTIDNLPSPRNFVTHKGYGYVTSLFSPDIIKVNLSNYEVDGKITTGYPTEHMIVHNGYLYTNYWNGGDLVLKINLEDQTDIDSINVGYQPQTMVLDKNDNLWVVSDGGYEGGPIHETPSVSVISTDTWTKTQTFLLDDEVLSITNLSINPAKDSIFLGINKAVESGVYAMSINESEFSSAPLIDASSSNLYFIQAFTKSDLYYSDAKDFTSQGEVYRYSRSGTLRNSFDAGIIPGQILAVE